jgi:hypothetical protein
MRTEHQVVVYVDIARLALVLYLVTHLILG